MAIIHAVVDAQRLSDNKIAAHHVDMGALQQRYYSGSLTDGGNFQLQHARSLFHQFEGFGVGDAGLVMVDRFVVMLCQIGINLRACHR